MTSNISVKSAAILLGKPEQFVRVGLQQQRLPFGAAVKGTGRWAYHISPARLARYMGVDMATFERQLGGIEHGR